MVVVLVEVVVEVPWVETCIVTDVECERLPLVPVMVTVYVPDATLLVVVTVSTAESG